ncbi:MAG TPA: hypothetical protein VFH61_14655 [Thermoleophilia bacterium]|nr:hypothetical protein [Thermoleophilia bacterium]
MKAEAKSDQLSALRAQLAASKAARSDAANAQVAQAQKCSVLPTKPTQRMDYDKVNGIVNGIVNGAVNGAVNGIVNGAKEAVDLEDVTQARQLRRNSLEDLKRTSFGVRTKDDLDKKV